MAGKSYISDPLAMTLVRAASIGLSVEGCARVAGVSRRTVHSWLAKGRRELEESGDGASDLTLTIFGRFARAFDAARGNMERDLIATLFSRATSGGVEDRDRIKAATWLLERSFPKQYSERHQVEVGGAGEFDKDRDWTKIIADRLKRARADVDGGGEES